MGAIATSDMPGHKQLHEQVYGAIDRCQETSAIEFKESSEWESMKWQIIRTVMGMGNLRDGGIIVIGVSERDDNWKLTGISKEHLGTYDVDDIADTVNKYASPPVDIEIVRVTYSNGKEFLALKAKEFDYTPHVCGRNGPDGSGLYEGDIYIRPPGKPQTKKVTRAQEMADLLELAAEKRARRIISTSRRVGFVPPADSGDNFDKELDGLC